jgi:hypothetical protein
LSGRRSEMRTRRQRSWRGYARTKGVLGGEELDGGALLVVQVNNLKKRQALLPPAAARSSWRRRRSTAHARVGEPARGGVGDCREGREGRRRAGSEEPSACTRGELGSKGAHARGGAAGAPDVMDEQVRMLLRACVAEVDGMAKTCAGGVRARHKSLAPELQRWEAP